MWDVIQRGEARAARLVVDLAAEVVLAVRVGDRLAEFCQVLRASGLAHHFYLENNSKTI